MMKKPTVLMVDDEPDILNIVGLLLKTEGHEVHLARGANEALRKLKDQTFDVVVCDYFMPGMDGIELLKKVREHKDYTPFIFFSGHADHAHEIQMIGLGACQLVPKSEVNNLSAIISSTMKLGAELRILSESKSEDIDDFLKILHSAG